MNTVASLAQQAYLRLEELLVTLALEPGATITEGALIEQAGFGRTPVREAIQRLSWEGLMEIRPRSGIAIAPLDPADWMKVIDARRGVEAVLARGAACHLDTEGAHAFGAAALAMQNAVAASDTRAFLAADKAFDMALAHAADNSFAARLAAPLQTHSRRFWFRYARPDGLAEAAEHHIDIISAILDRDEKLAESESLRLMALLADMAARAI